MSDPLSKLDELIEKRNGLQHAVGQMRAHERALLEKIRSLEQQLKDAKEQREKIVKHDWYGQRCGGQLMQAERELATVEKLIADEQATPVVFTEERKWDDTEYIVDRVTAKQIYVRAKGQSYSTIYLHNGLPVGGYNRRIDIAKTFPDGLPVPKKAKKDKVPK